MNAIFVSNLERESSLQIAIFKDRISIFKFLNEPPSFRNIGLGKQNLDFIKELGNLLKVNYLQVFSSQEAIEFYEKNGFSKAGYNHRFYYK